MCFITYRYHDNVWWENANNLRNHLLERQWRHFIVVGQICANMNTSNQLLTFYHVLVTHLPTQVHNNVGNYYY